MSGRYHLRNGWYFERIDAESIELTHDGGTVHRLRVSVNEWASVMASTSLRGETGDTWREAVDYLNADA